MNNTIADLLIVDVVLDPVSGVSETQGGGITGQIVEGQIDHMVESMDGNVGGPTGGEEVD